MSENAQTVRRFLQALERLDAAPIAQMLTDDVSEVLPLAASGSTEPAAVFEGRDAVVHAQTVITDSFSAVAFGDLRLTESDDGQTVFVESLGRRVHRETGRVYMNTYVLKFEFEDALIRRITEYSNPVTFAKFFDRPIG